jgi:hypothetical protein
VGPNSIRTLLPVFLVPPPPPLHCALDNYGRRRSRTRISKKTLKKTCSKTTVIYRRDTDYTLAKYCIEKLDLTGIVPRAPIIIGQQPVQMLQP